MGARTRTNYLTSLPLFSPPFLLLSSPILSLRTQGETHMALFQPTNEQQTANLECKLETK